MIPRSITDMYIRLELSIKRYSWYTEWYYDFSLLASKFNYTFQENQSYKWIQGRMCGLSL